MRPTFMGLETAKRGIMVNQKAIDIVGNNISNINTKGYTRQRLDSVSVHVYGSDQYNYSSIPLAGQGVDARGVAQIRNPYLDAKFREQYSDVGYFDQKAAIMDQIEGIISDPEVEGTGIKSALTTLSQALADFSQYPYQQTNANIVMHAFQGVTQVLNEYDANLKTLMEQTKNDFFIAVKDINTKLDQLSELNRSIAHEVFVNSDYDGVNYGPNDLLDQRNTILDDLSRYGVVQVTDLEDGKVQVKFNGKVVVDASGASHTNDHLTIGKDGTSLTWDSSGKTANLGSGAIRGFTDMLTGGDSITAGIPYYQNQLDHLAKTLAHVFNSKVHADDPAQPDKYKELLSGDGNGNITAGNISISDKWAEDSSYIIREKNPDGDLDNTDIMAMKAALEQDFDFGGEFTGTFSEFVARTTSILGSDIKTNNSRMDASLFIAESVEKERMSVSGVSLNEEGINMMTYNKAYQALGRLMTTMDEQLDMIINKMGMVGR